MHWQSMIAAIALCGSAAAAAAETPPTPATSASSQGSVDPKKLTLAIQIYELVGIDTFKSLQSTFTLGVRAGLAQTGADEVRQQAVVEAVNDGMRAIMPMALNQAALVMSQNFTYSQLVDILSFYQSPTGRYALKKLPSIMQQVGSLNVSLAPMLIQVMQASYCRRVSCNATEIQMFVALEERIKSRNAVAAAPPPAG